MSINKVCISGNLGRDPELKVTASGTQVCKFSMCVNDRKKNQNTGKWEDEPNWVDVTFFGNRAESINKYISKGSHVTVSGRLHQNKWETKDGQKRSKLEVIGDDIDFSGSGQQEEAQQPQQGYQPPQGYQYANPQQQPAAYAQQGYQEPSQQQMAYDGTPDVYDEDIPF